jgi:hypothetical protein
MVGVVTLAMVGCMDTGEAGPPRIAIHKPGVLML